nr:oxidoreductase PtaJ-like protein [Trichoderma rhododendri]
MTATKASQVRLSPDHLGIARIDGTVAPGALQTANELLQKNHDEWHMYFQDIAGHNHIPHSLLTVLATGGGPEQLQRAYDDGEILQRPPPALARESIDELHDPQVFLARMVKIPEYSNFLVFFEQEIEAKGLKAVINEYCFTGTPVAEALFAQQFEGLYHPLIHLAFGVEFDQPSIVAEGLAQAASHHPGLIWTPFFRRSEELARSTSVQPKPLIELYQAVRANNKIRSAARLQDGPFRGQGMVQRASDELVPIAAQFQVTPETLERATAEVLSCSAFTAAAQKPGKIPKVDFFYLHMVTSALSVAVLLKQDWISTENKARLLEWKGRIDLTWYAANGAPELRTEVVDEYAPTLSKGMGWAELYRAANEVHDDGHVIKFIRSMRNGEDVVKPFEQGSGAGDFPIQGDRWLKLAKLCYDGTANVIDEPNRLLSRKWVFGAGFDPAWKDLPDFGSE